MFLQVSSRDTGTGMQINTHLCRTLVYNRLWSAALYDCNTSIYIIICASFSQGSHQAEYGVYKLPGLPNVQGMHVIVHRVCDLVRYVLQRVGFAGEAQVQLTNLLGRLRYNEQTMVKPAGIATWQVSYLVSVQLGSMEVAWKLPGSMEVAW
jgi:hypothetical protein